MTSDYKKQIAEFWPTIMHAWDAHGEKHPVIECDVVLRKVAAMPAKEYLNGLTDRPRKAALRQYEEVTAEGGIMVFIRDSKNRVLQSHVYMPDDTSEPKPNQTVQRTGSSRSTSGTGRTPGAGGSRR